MNRNYFLRFLDEARGDNLLSDEREKISYSDLPGMLKGVDRVFEENDKADIYCVGVLVENSLSLVMVLLYLLRERINFFLLPANSPVHQSMPFFCDVILSFDPPSYESTRPDPGIRLTPNPRFTRPANGVSGRSGSVFFTSSGTSGLPKYILFTAENLIRNAENWLERFGIFYSSRVLIPVPVGHMYGLGVGLLPALLKGASISLIEKNNVVKFFDRMAEFAPEVVLVTPALCKMILLLDKPLSKKALFISAGEMIQPDTLRRFKDKYGDIVNLYGCTEQGAIATTVPESLSGSDGTDWRFKPLENVIVQIDGGGQGEICCRHNAGFEWYVDTQGDIMPGADSTVVFRTKDMGLDKGDHFFEVLGRLDHFVNRFGYLVSLDEVEKSLESLFADISKAVVFIGDAQDGFTGHLIAICELAEGRTLTEGDVKAICRDSMQKYHVPDEFHFLAAIPKLNSGKVDRAYVTDYYRTFINNKFI